MSFKNNKSKFSASTQGLAVLLFVGELVLLGDSVALAANQSSAEPTSNQNSALTLAKQDEVQGTTYLSELLVIGGAEDVASPLAPNKINKEKFEKQQFTDVNRALKQTSGVYVREEEGQGLRPNIGLRGTNPDRSKKIVLMEDGVLSGPAPYSAPAAYYTPAMNHTESLEVYKGFQAVPYGPNSVGGAINYISKSLPSKKLELGFSLGSFETKNLKLQSGNENFLIHGSHWESSGFKQLDGGGNTGFKKNDFHTVGKYSLNPQSDKMNELTLRLGYADENSNETYLGLTSEDFYENPWRRYKASTFDNMKWNQQKVEAEHKYQIDDMSLLKTTLYRHNFARTWYRLDRFQDSSVKISDVLKDPTGSRSVFYGILTGEQDSSAAGANNGNLVVANNDRTYYSQGLQTQYSKFLQSESLSHQLDVFARVHFDRIDRDHTYDTWSMTSGELSRVSVGNVDAKNFDAAFAKTISLQDQITVGSFVYTVVGRFESVDFENKNKLTGVSTKRTDDVFVPGVGVLYKINEGLAVRGSVNKAATVSGLDSTGKEKQESSTNYEVGTRFHSQELQVNGDVTLFRNDYSNITGTCTASSGCSSASLDQQFNGGKALIQGLEASLAKGYSWNKFWIPVFVNATFIQAEFRNSFTSSSSEWGVGSVESGDPLPYVPKVQYSLGVGLQKGAWEQELTVIYQGAMYDQSVSSGRQQTEAYGILDWAGKYKYNQSLSFTGKVDNIFAREYVAAMKPFGLRPGKPQSISIGLNWGY